MTCTVIFDGVTLDGPIECEDPSPLRDIDTRGANIPIAGVDGIIPVEHRPDELDRTLTWYVNGRIDPEGAAHPDREIGVEQNLEFYRDLFDPRGGAAGTGEYPIQLEFAGATYAGTAQVIQYGQVRTGPTTATIITRLLIAAGELVLEGS